VAPLAVPNVPPDAEWTFLPDASVAPSWPFQAIDNGNADEGPPRRRSGMARRLGVVIALGAIVTGTMALTHMGPFHAAPGAAAAPTTAAGPPTDIRGVWTVLNGYAGSLYVATLEVTREDVSTGAFSGTVTSPVGIETMSGTVTDKSMTFVIDLGSGTEQGSAAISLTKAKLRFQGVFSNKAGGTGTIVATRTAG
jgi:hypothetical protein